MNDRPSLVRCLTCERLRPSGDFYAVKKTDKTYWSKSCKTCCIAKGKARDEKVLARRPGRKRPRRLTEGGMSGSERRAFWVTHKASVGCVDCGEQDWRVLEFDHLPGRVKRFDIGDAVTRTGFWSDDDIAAEVAKCEVACNPCHLKRTSARKASPRVVDVLR